MRELLLGGALVQASSALILLAQNVLAPMLMGANAYGEAVGLVAVPLLFQAIVEPMINGAAILTRGTPDHLRTIGRSWRHTLSFALLTLVFTIIAAARASATIVEVLLLSSFVVMSAINTALRALAFAGCRYRLLFMHNIVALLATFMVIPLLYFYGSAGYLGMLCLVQLVVTFVLFRDQEVRDLTFKAVRELLPNCASHLWPIYVANVAPRLAQSALGPGMLLLASLQMVPEQIAEFRLLQTMSGALGYALPVNATLLQSTSRKNGLSCKATRRLYIRRMVFVLLLVSVAAAFVLWLAYPLVASHVLDMHISALRFHMLLLVSPLYTLAPIAAGVLLGYGHYKYVLYSTLVFLPVIVVIGLLFGADLGFFWGCVLYGVSLAYRLIKVALDS